MNLSLLWWAAVLLSVLFARILWVELRQSRPARQRLQKFLESRAVSNAHIRVRYAYGWPRYEVMFDSEAEGEAFRKSPAFDALVGEVQRMHDDHTADGRRFNARDSLSVRIL